MSLRPGEPCRTCVERLTDWRCSSFMGEYENRKDDDVPAPEIQPAEFIVWGKLFPPEALGPRCYDHAAEQIGHRGLYADSGWAIYRIPKDPKDTVPVEEFDRVSTERTARALECNALREVLREIQDVAIRDPTPHSSAWLIPAGSLDRIKSVLAGERVSE